MKLHVAHAQPAKLLGNDSKVPIFTDLLFRKSTCIFVAFDLLYLNGEVLRALPLIERKRQLRKLLRRKRSRILYLDDVENDGRLLFEQILLVAVVLLALIALYWNEQCKPGASEPSEWLKGSRKKDDAA